MLNPVNASTQLFLNGVARLQTTLADVQDEVSSGLRVRRPSADPYAVQPILECQARISQQTQTQTNLDKAKTELESADAAVQQAVMAVERAIAIATEGASTTSDRFVALAKEAQGIQQQLVSISRTSVAGRYIFSGDLDQEPMYELDPTSPSGVRQIASASATRLIADGSGEMIRLGETARDLFDPEDPGAGKAFAAVNALVTALKSGNSTAVAKVAEDLNAAHDHLNQQLGFYGLAETRVSDAYDHLAKSITTEEQRLSGLQDADVAGNAIEISRVTLQQQAALSARAQIGQLSLFDMLA